MTEPDFRPSADAAMDRYARGEDAAFAELYDLLGPRIEAFLMRRTRDRAQAEDLVQQTFLHIHRARQHFAPGAAVMPWAFAIARRLVIDKFRHTQRQPALVNLEEIAELPPGAFVPAPDELVGMRRLTQRVELELGELPESYRLVFELIQLDGLSMAEAAEVLGTSIPAVKMRAHRVYEALRKKLHPAALESL